MAYYRAQLTDGQLAILQIDDTIIDLLPVLSPEPTITVEGVTAPSWAVSLDHLDEVIKTAGWHRFSDWVQRQGRPTCMVRRPDLYERWGEYT